MVNFMLNVHATVKKKKSWEWNLLTLGHTSFSHASQGSATSDIQGLVKQIRKHRFKASCDY